MRLLAAVRAELGAEETRHQQTTGKLREIERLALELDGDHAQVEPTEKTPQQRGRPRAAAKRRQSRPAPKGANAARVLHALGEGPVRASELARRAKVPKGSITGVLEQLARDGKVNRPAERGGGWTLASPRGPTPKDYERGTVPVLIGRVLEVVSHERLGTAGIARELDEPVAEVARALAELDQKGDVRRSGEVWEAAW